MKKFFVQMLFVWMLGSSLAHSQSTDWVAAGSFTGIDDSTTVILRLETACDSNYEYGVVLLHGAGHAEPLANALADWQTGKEGLMNKFKQDCSLVYAIAATEKPNTANGTETGYWSTAFTDVDGYNIVTLLNGMLPFSTPRILFGGSSGAVMTHAVAAYALNHPGMVNLSGIFLAEAASGTLVQKVNPNLLECGNSSSVSCWKHRPKYTLNKPIGIELLGHSNSNEVAGITGNWTIPALFVQSDYSDLLIPNEAKNEVYNAVKEHSSNPSIIIRCYQSIEAHNPWTDRTYELAHQFIKTVAGLETLAAFNTLAGTSNCNQ